MDVNNIIFEFPCGGLKVFRLGLPMHGIRLNNQRPIAVYFYAYTHEKRGDIIINTAYALHPIDRKFIIIPEELNGTPTEIVNAMKLLNLT